MRDIADRDRHRTAGLGRDLRRDQFGAHPAGGIAGRWLAPHRLDLWRDRRYYGNMRRFRVPPWIGGVEPVNVGQQHQLIGLHHLRHPRRQPVIVAEANFRRGD